MINKKCGVCGSHYDTISETLRCCREKKLEPDKNDGGPAFPVMTDIDLDQVEGWSSGMSLRDWYLGQIIKGAVSHYGLPTPGEKKVMIQEAVDLTDMLLKARQG